MKNWLVASLVLVVAAVGMLALLRGADQPASQTTSPPRTPDGQPNLNGIWQVLNTASWDIQDHHAQLGVPAGQGVVEGNEIPYQPWALQRKLENFKNRLTADHVESRGFLPGVPRVMYMSLPLQIAQTPNHRDRFRVFPRRRMIYRWTKHPEAVQFWMGTLVAVGRGYWSWARSISTTKPGSTRRVISTARRCTWSSASRSTARTTSTTKSPSRTRRCSRGRGR